MTDKLEALKRYFNELGSVAIAFSGGVDSTFLLKVAHDTLGDRCIALTAKAPFFPGSETQDTKEFCEKEGIRQILVSPGQMELETFLRNDKDRCYYCKHHLFETLLRMAAEQNLAAVAEGSNVDDLGDYRPGLRALEELKVKSPLRECGFTKAEIRECSKALGLPTWEKQSFACLASRIPYGERITEGKLHMVEQAEEMLRSLGLLQYRVRIHGEVARIEVRPGDFSVILEHRAEITEHFKAFGFRYISLDLQGYRTGSMNEALSKEPQKK